MQSYGCINGDTKIKDKKYKTQLLLYTPSLSTRTRSLSMTVGMRCAMVHTVQSLNSVRIIFWIRLSVAVSTEAVASSSTSIFDCFSSARPRETSCRCPTLQLSPFSRTAGYRIGVKITNCDSKHFYSFSF